MRKKDVVEEEIEYLIEQKMNPKDKKEREEEAISSSESTNV